MNLSLLLPLLLRRFVLAGIFAAPFVVFFTISEMYFPFISGKNFIFRILVELIFGAWIVLAVIKTEYRPKSSPILWMLSLFLGIVFFADLSGVNVSKSMWSNYERMEGFVGLAHFFLYFLVAGTMLSKEKLWERWFQTTIFASVLMAFYGLLQLGGAFTINQGGVRLDGTFGNAAYLAVYMLFHFFLTAFLWVRTPQKTAGNAWWYGIAMVLQLVVLYFSGTRGAMIGLFAGVFLAALLTAIFERKNIALRRTSAGLIALVCLLIGTFIAIKDIPAVKNDPILGRFASISLSERTTQSRFLIWGMAIEGFKERPVLGWGQENFNFVFNKYYRPEMYSQEQWFDRAHNIFFDWLIAGGILGLLGYLGLFATAVFSVWTRSGGSEGRTLWQRIRFWFAHITHGREEREQNGFLSVPEKSILTGLLAAYFIHNFFVFDNFGSYLLFFSFLAFVHFRALSPLPDAPLSRRTNHSETAPAVLALVGLFIFISLYFINIRPIYANLSLINGLQPQTGGVGKNLEYLTEAVNLHPIGRGEAREQLVQIAIKVKEQNAPQDIVQKFYESAKKEILAHNADFPGDARYESFAGLLFSRFGQHDEAREHMEKAHSFSPKKQTLDFELINVYLSQGDTKNATRLAKEAYDLEPDFDNAIRVYATTLVYNGEPQRSDELLVQHYGTSTINDFTLANAYTGKKNLSRAEEFFSLIVRENPSDADNRLRLAAILAERGRLAEAISHIRAVIQIRPDFKERGEGYIKDLESKIKPGKK